MLRSGASRSSPHVRGPRQDDARLRNPGDDALGGPDQVRQDRVHFVAPAAGQQRDERRVDGDTEAGAHVGPGPRRRHHVEERMADPLDRHAGITIDALLEFEDHQDAVGDAAHRLHAPRTPGPELRADVVDDRHPELAQGAGEREVEVGKIDGDEDVWTFLARVRDEAPVDLIGPGQDAGDFEQAGHGQAAEVSEQGGAGGAQPIAAESGHRDVRCLRANLARELGGVQITRRFAARDHHPHANPSISWGGRTPRRRAARCTRTCAACA